MVGFNAGGGSISHRRGAGQSVRDCEAINWCAIAKQSTPPGWPWVLVWPVRKKPNRTPGVRPQTQSHTGPVVNPGPYSASLRCVFAPSSKITVAFETRRRAKRIRHL